MQVGSVFTDAIGWMSPTRMNLPVMMIFVKTRVYNIVTGASLALDSRYGLLDEDSPACLKTSLGRMLSGQENSLQEVSDLLQNQ